MYERNQSPSFARCSATRRDAAHCAACLARADSPGALAATPPATRASTTRAGPAVARAYRQRRAQRTTPGVPRRTESSTEQGQTPLDESFGPRTARRVGARDAAQGVGGHQVGRPVAHLLPGPRQVRRHRERSLGHRRLGRASRPAISASASPSARPATPRQRCTAPEDKDGTLLLEPGQEGYAVLGELYGEFLFNDRHAPDRRAARHSTRRTSTATTAA